MELTINIITMICTVIMTVIMVKAAVRYVFKEKHYGVKADELYKEFELNDKKTIESYPYEGGNVKTPQILIEKQMGKRKITYIDKNRNVKVWYLK